MDIENARQLLEKHNKQAFHLNHAKTVSGVMRYFAKEHDPEREEFWAAVGLLHDIDFEEHPEEHCVKGEEILRGAGADDSLISSTMSHGWGLTESRFEPSHVMEKILFAIDELTGLIGAVAIMRPSKSVQDLPLNSVKK
jgi:predicted hydrolase (HD superfamily)